MPFLEGMGKRVACAGGEELNYISRGPFQPQRFCAGWVEAAQEMQPLGTGEEHDLNGSV